MSFNTRIDHIAEVVMGQSPKGEDVNAIGDGFPLLNGPTEFSSRYPNPVQFTKEGRKFSEPEDILFCVRGSTTGRMNYSDQKYAIGRGIAAIRGKNGYPTPFVRAVMERNLAQLLVSATGSTFPNVGRDLLLNFEVNVVSSEAALPISELIISLEDKVELNRQTSQTLEHIAQAIFKSWFVNFDPVKAKIAAKQAGKNTEQIELAAISAISGKTEHQLTQLDSATLQQLKTTAGLFPDALVDSELGAIPEGWNISELKDLSEKISKGTTPCKADIAKANDQESITFLKVRDISDDGEITRVGLDKIPESIHIGGLKRSILETNDLLFSIAGTIGRVGLIEEDLNNSNCNQAVAFIRLKAPDKYMELCWLNLVGSRVQNEVTSKVVQGVQANFSLTGLGEINIVIPDNRLLEVFNEKVVPIGIKRRLLLSENRKLIDLRDTLLPKLLSGDLSLDEEIILGAV